jgi:glutamate/tyrosine decarboxylase-like PLP-dependent enzyme
MAPIADLAGAAGAWLHVDGAFGLWAHAHPDLRDQAEGLDRADSWAMDGHKWLQVPYDCGLVFVRDPAAHKRAMGHAAAYLPNSETLRDPGDYVLELSRRARGLPVWAVLKALGREGVLEMIGRCCRLARDMAERLDRQPGITVLNEVRLNQVALTFGPEGPAGDAMTKAVLRRLQDEGVCYPSHGQWRGRQTIRVSVSGYATTEADADLSVAAIIAAWQMVEADA